MIDWAGSNGFETPRPRAVAGMSCVRPCAPAPEPACGLNPDSCLIRPASSAGSIPLAWAAAVISLAYGTLAGRLEPVAAAPPVAVAAGAPSVEASEAKSGLAPVPSAAAVASVSALAKLAVAGA